jgi:hypothetical protein
MIPRYAIVLPLLGVVGYLTAGDYFSAFWPASVAVLMWGRRDH